MPEFFLELFSEEIPARMQAGAAEELARICGGVLADLSPTNVKTFFGPRRIAFAATIAADKPGSIFEARGPRDTAPEAALAGFLGKYKATREDVVAEGGYFLLRRNEPAVSAADLIANALAAALAKFSWPKSMRWGQSAEFTWVRPLRRIVCLLDGAVIQVKLGQVIAGNETEGHRFLSPGAFAVASVEDWQSKLLDHHVIAGQAERRAMIVAGLNAKAAELGLSVAEDAGLIDEVTGLVEWPVPLIGKIDEDFMDLPPEVRELSMKVNQRYFALRDDGGKPAPYFAFVSNIEATDGGKAVIAGNERVLRARLSDARHFWDLDLKTPLDDLLPRLENITFHAKVGSQLKRVERIRDLAIRIADTIGLDEYNTKQAGIAGLLSKADLVTGMVGEFPELQGIIGGYYAEKNAGDWDGSIVGHAIKTQYQPKGPSDVVPSSGPAISVALADKLDSLIEFFLVGEKPTGSGDPYALRRAALGVIRIILENELTQIDLGVFCFGQKDLLAFIFDRLKVKLRNEGKRFDVLEAVFAISADGNLVRLMRRVTALTDFLHTPAGINLLFAYRRAANILKIEDAVDGPHRPHPVQGPLPTYEEENLRDMLAFIQRDTVQDFLDGNFERAMAALSKLRTLVDNFFENVTVNVKDEQLRRNRLQLLARLRDLMHQIADFSKIEG
jgi:glycyl-tRNA synthetase beta chain